MRRRDISWGPIHRSVCGSSAASGRAPQWPSPEPGRPGRGGAEMADITVSVTGNLVSDVAYQVTARGAALARFRVASTAKRLDRATGRWVDGETTYWNVTAWQRAAENARESLAKGHPVV